MPPALIGHCWGQATRWLLVSLLANCLLIGGCPYNMHAVLWWLTFVILLPAPWWRAATGPFSPPRSPVAGLPSTRCSCTAAAAAGMPPPTTAGTPAVSSSHRVSQISIRLTMSHQFCHTLFSILFPRRAGPGKGGRVLPAEEGLAAPRHPGAGAAAGQAQHLHHLALTPHQGE